MTFEDLSHPSAEDKSRYYIVTVKATKYDIIVAVGEDWREPQRFRQPDYVFKCIPKTRKEARLYAETLPTRMGDFCKDVGYARYCHASITYGQAYDNVHRNPKLPFCFTSDASASLATAVTKCEAVFKLKAQKHKKELAFAVCYEEISEHSKTWAEAITSAIEAQAHPLFRADRELKMQWE